MNNIILTGSSGLIGSNLLNFFKKNKKNINCFGIDPSAKKFSSYYEKEINLVVDFFSAKKIKNYLYKKK